MKHLGTVRRWLAIVLAAGLVLAGCGSDDGSGSDSSASDTASDGQGQGTPTERFRWGYATGSSGLDPLRVTSTFEIAFLNPMYDTLIRRTPAGDLEPMIADSWSLSDDGMQLTLEIADGRTFHDGTPIDAEAVVANLERARSEDSVVASQLALVESIRAVDEATVELSLTEPGGALPGVLADQPGMMVSPASFEGGTMPELPAGSGPFRAVSFSEAEVRYDRWEEYVHADQIRLAGIDIVIQRDDTARLASVRSGETDATHIRTNQLAEAEAGGLSVDRAQRTQFYGLHITSDRPEFADAEVRRALMHAIDRESIDVNLYDSMCAPSVQYFPSHFFAHDPSIDFDEYGEFDLDEAKDLLAAAGYADGFSVEITTPNITTYSRLAEVLQAQFGELGLNAEINVVESTELSKVRREGTTDLVVAPIDAGRPDPTEFYRGNFTVGGATNAAGFEIEGLDDLLLEANKTVEPQDRQEILHEVARSILDFGTPLIPVCIPDTVVAFSEDVSNLVIPVLGNWDFREVVVG